MASKDPILVLGDLTGGVNDSDSPFAIAAKQAVDARNVDFREGRLGSKRRGTVEINLTGSALNPPVAALIRHQPTNSVANDELWAIDSSGAIDRRVGGAWQGGVTAVNNFVAALTPAGDENGVSLHGKLFIAAQGSQDRLLVWDGTLLRWAGIAQPADPTVGGTGVGAYTGTRYFRIRYTEQVGGTTVRRSEPSNTVSLAPSGTGSGALVTKPAGTEATSSVAMDGQTHWEVEASVDNILFYRIATVAVGTATYTDTTAFTTGYSAFTLSERVGLYVPPRSARHVAVDEDRLVLGGSRFTAADDSTIYWSPVSADVGVGNDERIPTTTGNYLNLDGLDGGRINALVTGVSGNILVFKRRRVYKLVRTGVLTSAYDPYTESDARGSTLRGAVTGTDEAGVTCVYFIDPSCGLCRIGRLGVQDLAIPIRKTWARRAPSGNPWIIFYPELQQVWYGVSLDAGADKRVFVFEARYGANLYHDGVMSTATSAVVFPEITTLAERPHLGLATGIVKADSGTTDMTAGFAGYITSKPFEVGDGWTKFAIRASVLLAAASPATVAVTLNRNYGLELKTVNASLAAVGAEPHVQRALDNTTIGDCINIQVKLGDPAAFVGAQLAQAWSLDKLTMCCVYAEAAA